MEHGFSAEINGRIKKFQSRLCQKELDGALLMQNVDIFYFSGTLQKTMLFIPSQGNPLMMVLKNEARVRQESPLKDIVYLKSRQAISDTLTDAGFMPLKKIGIEMDVLPVNHYFWLNSRFKKIQWENITPDILDVRMIKSDYEIQQFKKGSQILEKGFSQIRNFIKPGMTEVEVDGYLSYLARKNGHMGIMRMRGWNQEMTYAHVLSGRNGAVPTFLNSPHGGSGVSPAMAQGAGCRKIKPNEPIGIDYGVAVNGYISDEFRTFVIGDLPEKLVNAHDCSKSILDMIADTALPGVPIPSLYEAAKDHAGKWGFADYFMGHGQSQARFLGHGLGLEIDEYPVIAPGFNRVLEKNMVIALEPKFVFPGQGVVGLEDDYVITDHGLERLTRIEPDIMHIV